MKRSVLILLTILFSIQQNSFSKSDNIRGSVIDQQQKPVEFANVVLLNKEDSSLVKAALTDETGNFIFEGIPQGQYVLLIAQIGFEKYEAPIAYNSELLELPAIKLEGTTVALKEARIEAVRPLIEHRVDRTVLNVENSIVNTGSTLLEILKRSPGVSVDNDGNISLKGKQGVMIMIDGKPTYLSASDLTNMLRQMRSEELSQIEIITNPSAKYDAAGNSGIINIVLKKKQNLGFNGSVHSSYGQGVYPDFSSGINLNYRNEKFNAFGSYNFWRGFYFEDNHLVRKFKEEEYTSTLDQNTFDKAKNDNHNSRVGMDYYLNDRNTIGFLVKGSLSTNDDKTTSTTEVYNQNAYPDSGYTTINKSDSKWSNYTANLNYRLVLDTVGSELTADVDFARYDNQSNFYFETDHFSNDPTYVPYKVLEKNHQPANITIQAAKIDWNHPLNKKMKVEGGGKTSFVTTDNDVKYYNIVEGEEVLDPGKSNHFNYTENINALYINWSGEFGKVGLQTGLRGEQTIAKGEQMTTAEDFKRDYLQLFPSAFVSYKITEKHQLGVTYSRRIDRPAYQDLNPFRYFLDPQTFQEGNPNLQPQLTNSFEFSHTFMGAITTAINYSHTNNAMTKVTKQIDSTRTTYVTTENFDSHDNFGFSLSIPYEISKWWLTSNNFNVFNNRFQGEVAGGAIDQQLTTFMFNTNNSFKLPKGWSVEVSGYYNSEMVWGTFLLAPQYSVGAGVGKSFLHERLRLKVDLNDIFWTERTNATMKYNNVDATFKQINDTRFFRIHLSYNFGKQTVEQARRRRGGAEDEQNRVKTGK